MHLLDLFLESLSYLFIFFFNSKASPPLAFTELIPGGGVKALHSKKYQQAMLKPKATSSP